MSKKPLIFGISGPILTMEEQEFFKNHQVAGFILFKRNIVSGQQLISLVSELKSLYQAYRPLIFIDQEGGRVARLQPPIISTKYPSAEYFSNLYRYNKKLALEVVQANYSMLMQELKEFGIDSPCAPVADLHYPLTSDVIGDRSFGSNVEQVVDLCTAAIDGIASIGGTAIIKHIPGHGRASCDSHLELPVVTTSLKELMATDFAVFAQLAKNPKITWAMTAHIIFQAIDPIAPVTLSKTAIEFIRHQIGFKGLLVTDDICMFALHSSIKPLTKLTEDNILHQKFIHSLCDAAKKSLVAGCNVVLHCSGNLPEMIAIYDSV